MRNKLFLFFLVFFAGLAIPAQAVEYDADIYISHDDARSTIDVSVGDIIAVELKSRISRRNIDGIWSRTEKPSFLRPIGSGTGDKATEAEFRKGNFWAVFYFKVEEAGVGTLRFEKTPFNGRRNRVLRRFNVNISST